MSYDLFFEPRDKNSAPTMDELLAFFRSGKHYTINEAEAIYENQDTGVYFTFTFHDALNESAEEIDNRTQVAFNINYFRPHIFAMEAEPELTAFVRRFDFLVVDPQGKMGNGEYNPDDFLQGWNQANESTYRIFLEQGADEFYALATEQIERHWYWNHGRNRLQDIYGDSAFVPRVFFVEHDGDLASAVIWIDGFPVALPTVDLILFIRKSLAPSRLFVRREDTVLLEWNDIQSLLAQFRRITDKTDYVLLDYAERPQSLVSLVRKRKPLKTKLTSIPVDKILNLESVEKFKI